MPEGGSLVIGTEDIELDESYLKVHEEARPGLYVMISVSDTGRGMPPEIMERIFEPFFTTKELGKGTGLGLATVYGIIKQHNGFIYVYSEPDRGTTFKIYLPAGKEEAMAELQSDTEDMPSGSETIVVVDDDTLVRRLAVDTLQPLGYTVIEAQSGEDAVRAIDNYHGTIDLLLTDVIMPGINGAELARLFRTKRPGKKVVFMSGYTDDAISRHGVLNRDVILINKPIIPHKLAQEVRRALDNKGAGSS
jgi:CheY-like chemotaxis protein